MADDNDTAPATGRDYEIEPETSTSYTPNKAWADEFQKQTTPKLINRLRKYARMRAGFIAACGRKVDAYYVRELVQDALGDTWLGVLRWDPKRHSLEAHLVSAIKSRTKQQGRRALEMPHVPIGDDVASSRAAEEDASNIVAAPEYPVLRIYTRESLALIRTAAAGDKDVLRILDALQAGAQTREDVLAVAKMKAHTYHKAHIRLMRIVRKTLAPKARA